MAMIWIDNKAKEVDSETAEYIEALKAEIKKLNDILEDIVKVGSH